MDLEGLHDSRWVWHKFPRKTENSLVVWIRTLHCTSRAAPSDYWLGGLKGGECCRSGKGHCCSSGRRNSGGTSQRERMETGWTNLTETLKSCSEDDIWLKALENGRDKEVTQIFCCFWKYCKEQVKPCGRYQILIFKELVAKLMMQDW